MPMIEIPKQAEVNLKRICVWGGTKFQIYVHTDTNAIEINNGGHVKIAPVESYFDPGGGISIPTMPGGSSYPKESTWRVPKEMLVTEKISEGNRLIQGSKPEQNQKEPSGTEWILIRNGLYYFMLSNTGKILGSIEHSNYDDCYTAFYDGANLGKFFSIDHAKRAVQGQYRMGAVK
jgi:hypothetical protein